MMREKFGTLHGCHEIPRDTASPTERMLGNRPTQVCSV